MNVITVTSYVHWNRLDHQ